MHDWLLEKLRDRLAAEYVHLEDETALHQHHAEGGSGHYRLVIVSPQFVGKSPLQQHRLVYGALAEEMQSTIHALAIQCFTPAQWRSVQKNIT